MFVKGAPGSCDHGKPKLLKYGHAVNNCALAAIHITWLQMALKYCLARCGFESPGLSNVGNNRLAPKPAIVTMEPQARATPSWWTQNKCCPHSLLPGIEYSRHVTPWAISGVPHYRLKSIKVFRLITSRTLPKKCMHSGKYMTFLKIIHTSMTRYICALAVLF